MMMMIARKEKILAAVGIAAILVVSTLQSSSMLDQVFVGREATYGQAAIMGNGIDLGYHNEATDKAPKNNSSQSSSSFLLPKNDFRPVTQLRNNDDCTPGPHQPLHKVSDLFENYANATRFFNLSSATTTRFEPLVCEFKIDQAYSKHFAHSMQQLYGCYSFYQQHHQYQHDRPKVLLLSSKTKSQFGSNSFLSGYLQVLQDEMGVQILSRKAFHETYHQESNVSSSSSSSLASIFVPGGYVISHVPELNQIVQQHMSKTTTGKTPKVEGGSLCGRTEHNPRIGILNRRPAVGRSIKNAGKLVERLANVSQDEHVSLEYFEGKSFIEQVEFFQRTDILLSPHGAQLTGLPFLANTHKETCSQLLELFPANYIIPAFYGSLARNSGIGYSYLYLSSDQEADHHQSLLETHEASLEHRVQARAANLCLSLDAIENTMKSLVNDWRECCRRLYPTS
jgi:hypothetical protein